MGDSTSLASIMATRKPDDAKKLGRQIKPWNEELWQKVRSGTICKGTELKFSQNSILRDALLQTGDATLVEASPYDRIRGVGISVADAEAGVPWQGMSLLGLALEHVRGKLRREDAAAETPLGITPDSDAASIVRERSPLCGMPLCPRRPWSGHSYCGRTHAMEHAAYVSCSLASKPSGAAGDANAAVDVGSAVSAEAAAQFFERTVDGATRSAPGDEACDLPGCRNTRALNTRVGDKAIIHAHQYCCMLQSKAHSPEPCCGPERATPAVGKEYSSDVTGDGAGASISGEQSSSASNEIDVTRGCGRCCTIGCRRMTAPGQSFCCLMCPESQGYQHVLHCDVASGAIAPSAAPRRALDPGLAHLIRLGAPMNNDGTYDASDKDRAHAHRTFRGWKAEDEAAASAHAPPPAPTPSPTPASAPAPSSYPLLLSLHRFLRPRLTCRYRSLAIAPM